MVWWRNGIMLRCPKCGFRNLNYINISIFGIRNRMMHQCPKCRYENDADRDEWKETWKEKVFRELLEGRSYE